MSTSQSWTHTGSEGPRDHLFDVKRVVWNARMVLIASLSPKRPEERAVRLQAKFPARTPYIKLAVIPLTLLHVHLQERRITAAGRG